jgi:hypothetical protein
MQHFLGLEMLWTIFLDKFVFRFEPIFEVITNQSAVGAVDLVSAMQDFFNVQAFVDFILAEDSVFQLNSLSDFAMQMHVEVDSFRRGLLRLYLHAEFPQGTVSRAGGPAP